MIRTLNFTIYRANVVEAIGRFSEHSNTKHEMVAEQKSVQRISARDTDLWNGELSGKQAIGSTLRTPKFCAKLLFRACTALFVLPFGHSLELVVTETLKAWPSNPPKILRSNIPREFLIDL